MIRKINQGDLIKCIDITVSTYMKLENQVIELQGYDITEDMTKNLKPFIEEGKGYVFEDNGVILGYMIEGYVWLDGEVKHIHIPAFGCGIEVGVDRQTILQKLFQQHAAVMAEDGRKLNYEIKLYVHDKDLITAFIYEQFGFISLDGIKQVDNKQFQPIEDEVYILLSKDEIEKKKETILKMYHSLVDHLKSSPVFYPGYEFTDEAYMDYILEEGTNLYGVFKNDHLIGMIGASKNENSFLCSKLGTYDIGDVYIEPEYRGLGIASRLLQFAESDLASKGIDKLHVEHGTANINARLFWDKYFNTVMYSLIREINYVI